MTIDTSGHPRESFQLVIKWVDQNTYTHINNLFLTIEAEEYRYLVQNSANYVQFSEHLMHSESTYSRAASRGVGV